MVGTVAFVARCHVRGRGRRLLVLALLIGVIGTVTLGAIAGARRSASALERFKDASRAADIELDGAPTSTQIHRIERLPGVAAVGQLRAFGLVIPDAPDFQLIGARVGRQAGRTVDRDRFIRGRHADPNAPREITIGEGLADRLGLDVGDRLVVESFSPAQVAATLRGQADAGPRRGPTLRLRVAGIVRRPLDLGDRTASDGLMILTPAFDRTYRGRIGVYGTRLRIRTEDGAANVPSVTAAGRRILGAGQFSAQGLSVESQGARSAIDALALALWIAALVAAVGGTMTLAIVFTREIAATASDSTRLRDLGATRLERAASSAAGSLIAASLGALLTVAGAIAVSPAFPIEVARRADPDIGVHADWPVLAAGFAATVLILTAIALVTAWRATSDRRSTLRRPTLAHWAASSRLAPTRATGLRMALDGSRLGGSVPVRAACTGATVGIIGVVAALVFSASLDRLVASPGRFGAPWQFVVQDTTSNTPCGSGDYGLARRHGIADLTELCTQQIEIAGRPIAALTFARRAGQPITPVVVAGRVPATTREIALGAKTLAALDRHVGDHVTIARGPVTRRYRIVGRAVLPTLAAAQDLGDGAVFTSAGYAPLFDQNLFSRYFVGRYATGVAPAAVRRSVDAVRQLGPVTAPPVPAEIARLRQIGWLPAALALLLGTLGLIAVGHALVTAVRRRRREFAVLKTLGFDRRQVRATVGWQATTLAVIGLVLGVPLGLLAGGLAWRQLVDGLGIESAVAVPVVAIMLVTVIVVVLVNAIALSPARSAGAIHPAMALQSE